MALATRKNGVPLINKAKASGVNITSLGQKFLNLDFEFMQFEISTTQAGTTDLHSNWRGNAYVQCADVSWGDGSFETVSCNPVLGENVLHSYASNGNYSIRYYSITNLLLNGFRNVTGQTTVATFITDITSWGWTIGDPKFENRFGSDYVSVISATDLPGRVTSIGASGTAITFVGIANFPDDLWQPAGFANSVLYNEDFSSVRPATLGTSAYAKFRLARAFNRDLGRWSENNMTRTVTNFERMFELTLAFNNGGVGGVGVGLDSWNVNQTYAKGTNTSVTTNKLIDSSATFISNDVVAGMEVYIVYQREFTTIASVDSETELTLNADLFTTSPQNYLIRESADRNALQEMFYLNQTFNQYLGSWDITGLNNLRSFMSQRSGFGAFNQDLTSWDIVHVTNFQAAFIYSKFNFGNPIGQANTSAQAWNDRVWQVTNWFSAFAGTDFNSDTSGWSFGKLGNSSTNTTQTDFKLIDSTATFITDGVNTVEKVTNMDTGKQSAIASVDSETQLTLATNIFVDAGAGENYEIFRPVNLNSSGIIAVEYDVGVWDTRSVNSFGNITSYDSNRTQWDLSGWNTRNVNSLSALFASSGGVIDWDFEFRNWERGAIGDADYSTIKCVTSFYNMFYFCNDPQDKGCENWDTRNVTNMNTMNQNGRWRQSAGEWDIRSLTTANAAAIGGFNGIGRVKAQVYLQWHLQTPGPLDGVSATLLISGGTFSLTATESTVTSGTTTGVGTTTTDKVIDSTATFVTNGVAVGDTVNNTTTGKYAYVTSVDSETQLSVTQEYFGTSGDAYNVVTGYNGQEAYHGYRRLVAPTPATNRTTGTTTSTTTNKLVDSSATFLTDVGAGDLVKNTTDGTYSYVDSVDSDTELTLGNDIFVSGESYSIDGGFGWVISGTSFS
jgi:hypothetical protein